MSVCQVTLETPSTREWLQKATRPAQVEAIRDDWVNPACRIVNLGNSDCNDFTDIADDADYIQLPGAVNMISAVITPQVHKIARIYPETRKLPAGFSL